MKCQSCGATVPPGAGTCLYCDSYQVDSPVDLGRDVFAQITSSTPFAQRNSPDRIARLPKVALFEKLFVAIIFVAICGSMLALVIITGGGVVRQRGFSLEILYVAWLPALIFAIGLAVAIGHFKKIHRMEKAPVKSIPVIVIGKRTEVTGGKRNRSTTYYATFETQDGRRQEYPVWNGQMYGQLREDDGGVLFLRDQYAVDFDQVA